MKWTHTAMIAAVLAAAISLSIMNLERPGDSDVAGTEEEAADQVHVPTLNVMELAQIVGVQVWEYVVAKDMEGHLELTWEETGHAPDRLTRTPTRSWPRGTRLVVAVREAGEGLLEVTLMYDGSTSRMSVERSMGGHVHRRNIIGGIGVIGDDGVLFETWDDRVDPDVAESRSTLCLRIYTRGG